MYFNLFISFVPTKIYYLCKKNVLIFLNIYIIINVSIQISLLFINLFRIYNIHVRYNTRIVVEWEMIFNDLNSLIWSVFFL